MRRILVIAVGLALVPAAPVQAREVLRLKPSSPWNVHYAVDSCRLARDFGEGLRRVTLILDQFEPGDSFYLTLVGDSLRTRRMNPPFAGTIRFGPHEGKSDFTAETGKANEWRAIFVSGSHRLAPPTDSEKAALDEARRRGTRYELAPIGAGREAAATWLELGGLLRSDLVLETGSMGKALAGLRQCAWDTVRMWGLDIEEQKALSRKPHPRRGPGTWFDPNDYPSAMIARGYQGIVNFRIMVDAKGKPSSCHVQQSTRPKDFDEAVCRVVMKQAEFEPALDALGRPVASFWRQTVRFKLLP